jgi:predicted membrane channel-forming protein YqfA (hemolysin III family)
MDSFRNQKTTLKLRLLFYILLVVSILISVVANIIKLFSGNDGLLENLFAIVISALCILGFIVLILEVAKKWRFVAAAIFIGLALMIFLSFSSISSEFNSAPYMMFLLVLSAVAWAIAGIILIVNRNIMD